MVPTAPASMLATLIAHGETRQVARSRLIDALDSTAVFGLTTNTGFSVPAAGVGAFRPG